jgi:Mycothiol maleylpyruvate isomerase N-terminal domain/SCP-2 sterol transfer family
MRLPPSQNCPKYWSMDTPENLVQLIHSESERLMHYLHTLPPEAWRRPSACALWEVRDVVGHLTWVAEFFVDTISRGVQGDVSVSAARPPGDAPATGALNTYFAQSAIGRRESLGDQLLPTCSACYAALSRLLAGLTPPDWDKPCAFWPAIGTMPVRLILVQIVQELAIHGWDIRSRLAPAAPLSPESLPVLMARIPARLRGAGSGTLRLDAGVPTPARYRFVLTGTVSGAHDLLVENGMMQMEPAGTTPPHVTFRCETERFVLLMYRRLTLEPLRAAGQLVVEGDPGLTTAFDQWLKAA